MGGKMSRSKGKRGELEACEALSDVWPDLKRVYGQSRMGSDAPDIDGPGCPVWIEVKRQESINVHAAMGQARDGALLAVETDGRRRPPVIVHKRNRGEWLVTMRAKDLAHLIGER